MSTRRTVSWFVVLFFLGAAAVAEESAEKAAESKDPEKLKTGVIASYGSGKNAKSVDMPTVDSAPGDEISPVTGSVSRQGSRRCVATVRNASKDSGYSVNFDVVERDLRGSSVARRNFSGTVSASGSLSREVPCRGDTNLEVVLKSGRKVK